MSLKASQQTHYGDLQNQLNLLELIIDSMSEGVAVADATGQLIMFNPAAKEILGLNAVQAAQEEWASYYGLYYEENATTPIPTDKIPMVRAIHGEHVNNEVLYVRNTTRRGGLFIRLSARPLRDKLGNLHGGLVVFQDVTEEKKAVDALRQSEAKLRKAKEAAEVASRAKSEFLANITHEIRTPLGIMLGFCDMLLELPKLPDPHKEWIEVIRKNGGHLFSLVEGILDLSKIEAGKLETKKVTFPLIEEMANTLSSLAQEAEAKGLALETTYQGAIPEYVHSCPVKLRQIFLNIIGNAIKFTDEGVIRVSVRYEKPLVEFEVSDTGVGIADEHKGTLFKPFSQVDMSYTRKYGGTGLGLVLSRSLAEALGGTLELKESTPGKGSMFRFSIHPGVTKQQRPKTVASPLIAPDVLAGVKVLVVEDSLDNQVLLGHFLRSAGAEVHLARNGAEGVTKAMSEKFDLVLMDIQMPELDGYAATRALRAKGFKTPIIALTAHAVRQERSRCLRVGCDDYLSKPIDPSLLVRTVAKYAKKKPRPTLVNAGVEAE